MATTEAHVLQPGWTGRAQTAEACQLTFVQLARSLERDACALYLEGLSPVSVSFSSCPVARIGHLTTGAFLDLWLLGAKRDPRARERLGVVSLLDAEHWPLGDALVQVSEPRIYGSGLMYHVEIIEGALPESSGAAMLLIHPANVQLDTLRTPS